MSPRFSVDESGITFDGTAGGAYDVFFGDWHVWSFSTNGRRRVPWPVAMRPWLDGTADVVIRETQRELFRGRVRFGNGLDEIRLLDRHGIPVMIDKWGLIQRPFSGRGHGVIVQMLDVTRKIIDVCQRECDVRPWLAFGSLLGAARSGSVIGHDSDVDLAYLSSKTSIVDLNREMFGITRALRRAGLTVVSKNGSFVTVTFTATDGASGSVDLYSCFYLSDLLHESATVRARVPRSAVEPLASIRFEGIDLPAPAQPEKMLRISYGAGWQVPDPSFVHRPSRPTIDRFDGWFGSLMRNRRDWERHHRNTASDRVHDQSEFFSWARTRLPANATVIDIGAGSGADVLAASRAGHAAVGLDYARGAFRAARQVAAAERADIHFRALNLYDHRDALATAALLARTTHGPRFLFARGLLDSLEPHAFGSFLSMSRMLLRRGGTAFLEFAHELEPGGSPRGAPRRYAVDPERLVVELRRVGGLVTSCEAAPMREPGIAAATRLVVTWGDAA